VQPRSRRTSGVVAQCASGEHAPPALGGLFAVAENYPDLKSRRISLPCNNNSPRPKTNRRCAPLLQRQRARAEHPGERSRRRSSPECSGSRRARLLRDRRPGGACAGRGRLLLAVADATDISAADRADPPAYRPDQRTRSAHRTTARHRRRRRGARHAQARKRRGACARAARSRRSRPARRTQDESRRPRARRRAGGRVPAPARTTRHGSCAARPPVGREGEHFDAGEIARPPASSGRE